MKLCLLGLLLFWYTAWAMEKQVNWADGQQKEGKKEIMEEELVEVFEAVTIPASTSPTPIGSVPKVPSENSQKATRDRELVEAKKPLITALLPTQGELATSMYCSNCWHTVKNSVWCAVCDGCFEGLVEIFFCNCCFKGRRYR